MSIASDLCQSAMASYGAQWKFRSAANMRKYIRYLRPGVNCPPLLSLQALYHLTSQKAAQQRVFYLQPRRRHSPKHILFIHGGSFVNPLSSTHWLYLERLISRLGCSASVPAYGLVPQFDHGDAHALLQEHYQQLLQHHAPEDIVLMGDSAGGGLALAFAQWLAQGELPQAGGVVLLSPWLDLTLANSAIATVQEDDKILAAPGNQEAGRLWAAGRDPGDPELSPIYGSTSGLPAVCLLIGTHDILLPDARRLRDRFEAAGVALDYGEYPRMFHLWTMAPIPEARPALAQVTSFIEGL